MPSRGKKQSRKPAGKPKPSAKPASKPKPSAKPASKPKPSAKPASKPKPSAKPASKPKPSAKPASKPKPSAKPASKPKPSAKPASKPKPSAKPASKPADRTERQFRGAAARLRPRKSERGKVILVNTKGKRVPPSYRGKAFAAYVTKGKGRLKWVKKAGKPVAISPRSYRVEEFSGRSAKGAAKATLASHTIGRVEKTVPRRKGETSADWTRVAQAGKAALLETAKAEKGFARTLIVTIAATVRLPDGSIKVVPSPPGNSFTVHLAKGQTLTAAHALDQFEGKAYAMIAGRLSAMGYVSAGSAQFIAQLPANADVGEFDAGELRDSRGNPWNPGHRELVDVLSVDLITEQIARQ